MGVKRFMPLHGALAAFFVLFPLRPRYVECALVRLLPPLHVKVVAKYKGIAVYYAGLREHDGLPLVKGVVPPVLRP